MSLIKPLQDFSPGEAIGRALDSVGISQERFELWLGEPCNCPERKAKLDAVWAWAVRVLDGKLDKAAEYFDHITGS